MNYRKPHETIVAGLLLALGIVSIARAGDGISGLSMAQIEAREQKLTREISQVAKAYRQQMEPLSVSLKHNCLKEPDPDCFDRVRTLVQIVMAEIPDPELFTTYKAIFSLPSSHKLLDQMFAETKKATAKIGKLETERPSYVAESRWSALVHPINKTLTEADEILQGGSVTATRVLSRQEVSAYIGALQQNEAAMAQAAKAMIAKLEKAKADLAGFGNWAKNFPDYARLATDGVKAVSKKITELSGVQGMDRSALYAHHRQFVSGLPESLSTLSGLSEFGDRIRQERDSNQTQWGWPLLSNIYTRWQNDSYDQIMGAGLRVRLEEARAARHGAEYQGEYQRWKEAAGALQADEVNALMRFWSTSALDSERYAKDRQYTDILNEVLGEHGAAKASGLAPLNAVQFFERWRLNKQAREHHYSLVRIFNENSDLAAITAMKTRIEESLSQHPDFWNDSLLAHYGRWQGRQFAAYFKRNLIKHSHAAATVHMFRRHDPKTWYKACSVFDAAEVQAVVDLLQDGVIERASFEEPVRDAMIRDGDLTSAQVYAPAFWQEVLAATTQQERVQIDKETTPQGESEEKPAASSESQPTTEPLATPPSKEPAENKSSGFLKSILSAPAEILKGAGEALER